MPIINLYWSSPIEKAEKRDLIESVVDLVHETTDTPKSAVFVFFNKYDPEDVSNPHCPVVEINWSANEMRNAERKAELYSKLHQKLNDFPGLEPGRDVVIVNETTLACIGVGGVSKA